MISQNLISDEENTKKLENTDFFIFEFLQIFQNIEIDQKNLQ